MFSASLPLALVLVVLLASPVEAQQTQQVVSDDPVAITVALMGVVLAGAGFSMMLHQDEDGHAETGWLVGGVVAMGSGVTLTYLGLSMRTVTVTVAPMLGPKAAGARLALQWGHRTKR